MNIKTRICLAITIAAFTLNLGSCAGYNYRDVEKPLNIEYFPTCSPDDNPKGFDLELPVDCPSCNEGIKLSYIVEENGESYIKIKRGYRLPKEIVPTIITTTPKGKSIDDIFSGRMDRLYIEDESGVMQEIQCDDDNTQCKRNRNITNSLLEHFGIQLILAEKYCEAKR